MSSIKDKKDELARQHEAMLLAMQDIGAKDNLPSPTDNDLSMKSPSNNTPGSRFVKTAKKDSAISLESQRLWLPASGTEIELEQKLLPIDWIEVHPKNPRSQSLLNLNDPKMKEIFDDILSNGQQFDVLVTPAVDPDRPNAYLAVYGSTRIFILKAIQSDPLLREKYKYLTRNGNVQVLVKVPVFNKAIPDSDSEILAINENEKRRDLSAWEKAKLKYFEYADALAKHGSQKKTIAALGISAPSLQRVQFLGWIPVEVMQVMTAPDAIQAKDSVKVKRVWEHYNGDDQPLRDAANAAKEQGMVFNSWSDFVKKMLPEVKAHKPVTKREVYKGENGGPTCSFMRNPKDKSKAVIEIEGLGPKHEAQIKNFLAGISIQKL